MTEPHIVFRVTLPTVYSYEQYGTQWRYTDTDGREYCYLQMSRDEKVMHWVRYGEVLEQVFSEKLTDASFLSKIMTSYYIKE